jgi:hypothetical protein
MCIAKNATKAIVFGASEPERLSIVRYRSLSCGVHQVEGVRSGIGSVRITDVKLRFFRLAAHHAGGVARFSIHLKLQQCLSSLGRWHDFCPIRLFAFASFPFSEAIQF